MAAKKRKKPAVCTRYALREIESGKWASARYGELTTVFDNAWIGSYRVSPPSGYEVVPVRCRALTSKAKNPKRTR